MPSPMKIGGAPLREGRAQRAVLRESLPEPVEPFGHRLAREEGERLGAGIHLDARDHPGVLEHLHERAAVRGGLADRLVVEDRAR